MIDLKGSKEMNTKRVPLTREEKLWNIFGMIVLAVVISFLLMGSEKPAIHAVCYIGGAIALGLFILDFKYGRIPKRVGEEDNKIFSYNSLSDPLDPGNFDVPGSAYKSPFDD